MITAPTAPSEFGTSVDDLAAAYSTQELQKRYKVTKELVYLLALQKLKSEMDAAQRTLAMSQQQTPGTVKQQLESQVMQGKMQEASGIMSQVPQMMQRQPQMAARGGIIGYQAGGGAEEDVQDVSFGDLAAEFGSGVVDWIKNNPAEAALLGISILPGVGPAAAGALRIGKMGLNYLRTNPTARGLAQKASELITKPRKVERVNQDQPLGQAAQSLGYPTKRGTTPSGIAGRQYSPGKGAAIASGIAGVSSAIGDDEEEEEVSGLPSVAGSGTGSGTGGGTGGGAGGAGGGGDPTEPAKIEMRPATDFQGIAQDKALSVEDLSPTLVGSLETQAAMSPEKMDERRDAEAKRYLDKIGAEERTQGLQNLYDEQVAVLDAQADPDELRRRRQLAFFSNIGTGGIGSILRGGGRGLMKETDAQRKEARDAAQTKITGYKSVHDFDINMIKDAEAKGLAILQMDSQNKRNAQTALANISRQDLASINSYADRLRASEDSRVQEQFQKLELLQENYENLRKDERLDYDAALTLYGQIADAEATVYAAEVAKLPDDVRELIFKSQQPGVQLSAKEQERIAQVKRVIDAAINATLNKMGVLDTKDEIIERVQAGFLSTRKSPVDPSTILGVGT